jgi:ubiquitin-conjugating enzyme E2 variant
LEKSEKEIADPLLSYGLENSEDISMSNWKGIIIGPSNTNYDGRIYSLKIEVGENYPLQPPIVKFISRVNLPFVDQKNGLVDLKKIIQWEKNSTIESILVTIKKNMSKNKKLVQPSEGTFF